VTGSFVIAVHVDDSYDDRTAFFLAHSVCGPHVYSGIGHPIQRCTTWLTKNRTSKFMCALEKPCLSPKLRNSVENPSIPSHLTCFSFSTSAFLSSPHQTPSRHCYQSRLSCHGANPASPTAQSCPMTPRQHFTHQQADATHLSSSFKMLIRAFRRSSKNTEYSAIPAKRGNLFDGYHRQENEPRQQMKSEKHRR
jgi:hypothetical protein